MPASTVLRAVVFFTGALTLAAGQALAQTSTPAAISPQASYRLPAGYVLVPFVSETPQRSFSVPGLVLRPNSDYAAVVETDQGRMVIDLFEDKTPFTVNSFIWLTLNHFYDGVAFHRVLEGFMAQTGDPNTLQPASASNGWGVGGAGYQYGLELRADLKYDKKGVLGMARSQSPASNGSQFFITFNETAFLNNNYTIFGQVIEGLDVLDKIQRIDPQAPDPKITPTRMVRVYIARKPK
jgi:peptidylprolyl isomerase